MPAKSFITRNLFNRRHLYIKKLAAQFDVTTITLACDSDCNFIRPCEAGPEEEVPSSDGDILIHRAGRDLAHRMHMYLHRVIHAENERAGILHAPFQILHAEAPLG